MHIFLFILKIIGIILLLIIGIILLAVGFVLLAPVRYEIRGSMEQEFETSGRIKWLFPAVCFCFSYLNKEAKYELRIFGIRMKKKENAENEESKDSDETEQDTDFEKQDDKMEKEIITKEADIDSENQNEDIGNVTVVKNEENVQNRIEEKSEKKQSRKRQHRKNVFRRLADRITETWHNFCEAVKRIFEFLKTIKKKSFDIRELVKDEVNKTVFGLAWKEIRYLISHFKFRKIKINLQFSVGEPDLTGQILGVLCMIPFFYQYQINVIPDFESEEIYAKGSFEMKGRARGVHALVSLLRLWKNQDVRKTMKKYLKK